MLPSCCFQGLVFWVIVLALLIRLGYFVGQIIFLVKDFASATSTLCHSSRSTGVSESLAGGHLSPSLHCLLKLWTRVLLTELNFYSPAAGKSKKRKKRIPVLLIQKEKLWLLREELLYVVSRIYRIQNTCYTVP